MAPLAIDWATVSSLATGAGTLVLAVATFSAVRSSNRSARIAEVALQEQRRPLLAASRLEDPKQKIMFLEGQWVSASGGRAAVEHIDGIVYLAISLRNVGSGIAVCQGWAVRPGLGSSLNYPTHAPVEEFRLQSRDLYVPAGDIGMWQGALRNPDDPVRAEIVDAIETGRRSRWSCSIPTRSAASGRSPVSASTPPRHVAGQPEPALVPRLGRPPPREPHLGGDRGSDTRSRSRHREASSHGTRARRVRHRRLDGCTGRHATWSVAA